MAKIKEETKKAESPEEKKKTITAFLLMFPAVLVGFIAIASSAKPFWVDGIIIGLLILQFIMLEQFVKDYYKSRLL